MSKNFYNFILNNDVYPVIIFIDILASHTVDVSNVITTPKAIRFANYKIFWCFNISVPTSGLYNRIKDEVGLVELRVRWDLYNRIKGEVGLVQQN